MDRWVGKVAIVTGASSGIGAAIVESLVREGLLVVGLARRDEKVFKLGEKLKGAKGKLYARRVDVSKEADILEAFAWVKDQLGGVNVLVNNAGTGSITDITKSSTDTFRRILDVNVLAVAICTREAVRSMKERGVDGHIFNINSVLGHNSSCASVGVGLYPSSKFAVTAMTEVVRRELISSGTKIKITSISPGIVSTEFLEAAGASKKDWDEMLTNNPKLQSEDVANALVYVLGTPPHVQITELTIRPVGEILV